MPDDENPLQRALNEIAETAGLSFSGASSQELMEAYVAYGQALAALVLTTSRETQLTLLHNLTAGLVEQDVHVRALNRKGRGG